MRNSLWSYYRWLKLKLLYFLVDSVLSWQRTQPWPKLCCLERKFTLNFRPSPSQALPSTRWITRHTKAESTSVSYLRVEQREQGMIRHGLRSPLENFSQKLVLKKKQLKLIYLLLFIGSNNKSFKHQFRLSFLENRAQETEENKLRHHWSFEVSWRLGRRCVKLHCGNV